MKNLIFVLLAILFNSNALAEWTRVGGGGDGSDLYMDLDTVRRNGNKVKAWTMQNFKPPAGVGKPKHLSNITQWEVECKEEQARMPAYTEYAGEKGSGKIIDKHTIPNDTWEPIPPASLEEAIYEAACDETIGKHKWELLTVDKSGGNKTTLYTYIDSTSVQRNGEIVNLWLLFDKRSVDHDPNQENGSLKINAEYDCERALIRDITTATYSANMGVGKREMSTRDTQWQTTEKGFMSYELLKKVCA